MDAAGTEIDRTVLDRHVIDMQGGPLRSIRDHQHLLLGKLFCHIRFSCIIGISNPVNGSVLLTVPVLGDMAGVIMRTVQGYRLPDLSQP